MASWGSREAQGPLSSAAGLQKPSALWGDLGGRRWALRRGWPGTLAAAFMGGCPGVHSKPWDYRHVPLFTVILCFCHNYRSGPEALHWQHLRPSLLIPCESRTLIGVLCTASSQALKQRSQRHLTGSSEQPHAGSAPHSTWGSVQAHSHPCYGPQAALGLVLTKADEGLGLVQTGPVPTPALKSPRSFLQLGRPLSNHRPCPCPSSGDKWLQSPGTHAHAHEALLSSREMAAGGRAVPL